MSPAVVPFVMIGIFAIFVGLVTWLAATQSKRAAENVRQLAETLGLQYIAKPPTLGLFYTETRAAGTRRGRQVELFPFATGSGKSRTQWCAVSAAVRSGSGLTFQLRRQGFGSKVMEMFGAKEIEVGDADFDRQWFIQTNQPEFLREAFLPEVRDKISALVRDLGTQARGMEFKLENGVVRYAEMGTFSGSDPCRRCQRAAEIVCDLADIAEVAGDQK